MSGMARRCLGSSERKVPICDMPLFVVYDDRILHGEYTALAVVVIYV